MNDIFEAARLQDLIHFPQRSEHLGLFPRPSPMAAEDFFAQLLQNPVSIAGNIRQSHLEEDIQALLAETVCSDLQQASFYKIWVRDMVQISDIFCQIQKTDLTGFCLSTRRGCHKYHVDHVPLRLLVTYIGAGTEWLPEAAADRQAFANKEPADKIVKDPSARQFMSPWDIAIFRGGPDGLLHRTPDAALSAPSLLMRLDHPSFWERVLKQQAIAEAG